MDRFIGNTHNRQFWQRSDLKSNMDRFIGKAAVMYIWQFGVFKIQYG